MFENFFSGQSRLTGRSYDQALAERLTGSARAAVVLAREEASHMNHDRAGTGHLLLGLLREDGGIAARALSSRGADLDDVRERVESALGADERMAVASASSPFTPRSAKVLEMAEREALRLGHSHVGTEHILLGLTLEPEGVAARVLSDLDVDQDGLRREVADIVDDDVERAPSVPNDTAATVFEARVDGLVVHVRCGVSDEERALPQALRVDLAYSYEAEASDDLAGTVDYGALIEGVAGLLEGEEFKLLETGVRRVGRHILAEFPGVNEVAVSVTKLRVPVARSLSGASVSATFRR